VVSSVRRLGLPEEHETATFRPTGKLLEDLRGIFVDYPYSCNRRRLKIQRTVPLAYVDKLRLPCAIALTTTSSTCTGVISLNDFLT